MLIKAYTIALSLSITKRFLNWKTALNRGSKKCFENLIAKLGRFYKLRLCYLPNEAQQTQPSL